ncbi:Uncharacterized protein APZ42_022171 [Daphnia magna]|uniref:Uncharacterized protein n=1 Tax=Daphnia magna TaxID=35525 RepID=A0A164W2Q7_9CRUS|nr:Uncharacterized protein APZ42_022171 [Daphnia magna]
MRGVTADWTIQPKKNSCGHFFRYFWSNGLCDSLWTDITQSEECQPFVACLYIYHDDLFAPHWTRKPGKRRKYFFCLFSAIFLKYIICF